MRALSTTETSTLQARDRKVFVRARVQNASGTWKILTDGSVGDTNWLDEIDLGESIDQPVPDATIALWKYQAATNTLAPLATGSAINVNDGGTYAALVDPGRRTDIALALMPATATQATATAYHTLFDGEIDAVEWGGEQVKVRARDRLMSHMADRWVESVTKYGFNPTGTAAATGTPIEDVIGATSGSILADWTDGRVVLDTPSSPSFVISPKYNQQPMSVLDASMQLAQLIGWDLRSRWTATAGAFRVRFFSPDRSAATTAWSFTASDIFDVQRLDIDRAQIRNVVELDYPSSTATSGRASLTLTATGSVSRFGRRWMKITEPADSPINTPAEAGTLASAALNDQKDPIADHALLLDLFWPVEVQDYFSFETDDRWYSSSQNLAVYSYRHRISRDEATTTMQVRGKPAGQYLRWKGWSKPHEPEKRRRIVPTVASEIVQSGALGKLDIVVQDPDRTVTKTEFAEKASATGGYGAFATTWDRSGGSAGATGRLTRGEDIDLVAKHNVSVKWRVSYGDNDLGPQTIEGAHSFDSDNIAEITEPSWDFDANGNALLNVRGDEDTANIYAVVATSTGGLSDPTATSTLSVSGRGGTISTGQKVATGKAVWARVAGANSAGDIGPVQTTQSSRRLGVAHKDGSTRSVTGTTAETTLETITVPAGVLGLDGGLRLTVVFDFNGVNDLKNVKIKWGGTTIVNETQLAAYLGFMWIDFLLLNVASASDQRIVAIMHDEDDDIDITKSTQAKDTSSSVNVEITGTLVNGSDRIDLEYSLLEYIGTD